MSNAKGIEDIYGLSPTQSGILFDYVYEADLMSYHEQNVYRFKGKMNPELIRTAFDVLVDRHTVLRTSFVYEGFNEPLQVVLRDRKIDLAVVEFDREKEEIECEVELKQIAIRDRSRRFDLIKDPLMRLTLVDMKENEFAMIWTFHHIIMDAWCVRVLIAEFQYIVEQLAGEQPVVLDIPMPYGKFIELLSKRKSDDSIKYWNEYLKGYNEKACLFPRKKPVDTQAQGASQKCFLGLGANNTATLKRYCELNNVTINGYLRSVWGIVIGKYKQTNDVVFGTIVPGRPAELIGSDSAVGLFISNIPIRVNYDDDTHLLDLVKRVQKDINVSEAHQHVSLAEIKRRRSALFDNIFIYQNFPDEIIPTGAGRKSSAAAQIGFELIKADYSESIPDNLIVRASHSKDLLLEIVFDANLYDEGLVVNLLYNFRQFLIASLADPSGFIRSSSIASSAEEESIIADSFGGAGHIDRHRSYWMRQFASPVAEMVLPQRKKTGIDAERYFTQSDWEVMDNIERAKIDLQGELNLFTFLSSAVYVLLYRYTTVEDLVIGTRVTTSGEQLAFRNNVSGEEEFFNFLQRVRRNTAAGLDHRSYSINRLLQDLPVGYNNSFVKVMVFPDNEPFLKLPESTELNIFFKVVDNVLMCSVAYDMHRYTGEAIDRIAGNLKTLIGHALHFPATRISNLPLVPENEKERMLYEFNRPAGIYPENTFLDLFQSQVREGRNDEAVIVNNERLSYGELDRRSNQLANYLRKKGTGPGAFVAFCMDRDVNMVTGILGIMKAGAVYVPIDAEFPPERIRYILEDTRAQVMLTSKYTSAKCLAVAGAAIDMITLDEDWPLIEHESPEAPACTATPDQIAYVIYTSGSTGRPKGIIIEHGALYSFLQWSKAEYASSRFDIVYAVSSVSFDLSIFEILYPLCEGKRLRLLKNGMSIAEFVSQDSFVFINTVHTVIQSLLDNGVDLANVSVLNFGGEATPLLVQRSVDTNRMEVRNVYGPTECTVYSTVYRMNAQPSTLIGKPVENEQVYVLDQDLELSPVMIPGEICIGGHGLARGYLNMPELTYEKFIRHPLGEERDPRLYRTGDVGFWHPDGNVDYLGRRDNQVKIRGFRIELGEIETVLADCEGVKQNVVMVRDDMNGNRQLIAYIVAKGHFNKEVVIRQLKEKLPDYMVPLIFLEMESFPVNTAGKVDRRSFPAPDPGELLSQNYEAPNNNIERQVADIWQEVIGVKRVGIHDDFFELGGHSLLALRSVTLINEKFNLDLRVSSLFNYSTVAKLAEFIQTKQSGKNISYHYEGIN